MHEQTAYRRNIGQNLQINTAVLTTVR